jgi:RNA polymerase subunit RPABC4/transcription elongation factor Spt4
MMHCQNCGQVNTQQSNFCRFCGTKVTPAMQYSNNYNPVPNPAPSSFENAPPPRPYSWKTDEFQLPDDKTPRSKPIDSVPPLPDFQTRQNMAVQPFQPAQLVNPDFHCPRCASQHLPQIIRQISTAGWITFGVLLITPFFFLFWIGLLIKEEVRVCPVCGFKFR